MGANHERRLITAVLAVGDISPATSRGIGVEAMEAYPDEWRFLLDRTARNGVVPSRADFKAQFPAWSGIKGMRDVDLHADAVAKEYANQLTVRMLFQAAEDVERGIPLPKLLENLDTGKRSVVRAMGGGGGADNRLSDVKDFLTEVQRRRKMAASGGAGTPFGFPTLDEVTGGMTPGQLVIFCSRPSVGKSYLMCRAAVEAILAGKTVLFFSLEMAAFSLQTRMLSMLAAKDDKAMDIDPSAVRKGSIGWTNVLDVKAFMKRSFGKAGMGDVIIVDNSDPASPLTEHRLQAIIEQERPDIAFLDYLQLFARINARGGMDLRNEVARMSSLCKSLGDMYKIPFVTASQINRPGESKVNPPSLSTLAESDSPGQDADVVITMVPPSRHVRKAFVAKNREGPDGDYFHLEFDPGRGVVEEVTADQAQSIMEETEL
jgi:replicative DNA helicase